MKLIKTASGKKQIKISKKEWQSIGKKAGWTKIAQPVPPVQQEQQAQPSPQSGEQFNQALDPRLKTVFVKALQGSGLSKQKVLPFLEQLFQGLGDVPLSKVTGLLKALSDTEPAQPAQPAQPMPQQPIPQGVDQGVAGQQTQTMVPQAG